MCPAGAVCLAHALDQMRAIVSADGLFVFASDIIIPLFNDPFMCDAGLSL